MTREVFSGVVRSGYWKYERTGSRAGLFGLSTMGKVDALLEFHSLSSMNSFFALMIRSSKRSLFFFNIITKKEHRWCSEF